jgi:hypothetical protein
MKVEPGIAAAWEVRLLEREIERLLIPKASGPES